MSPGDPFTRTTTTALRKESGVAVESFESQETTRAMLRLVCLISLCAVASSRTMCTYSWECPGSSTCTSGGYCSSTGLNQFCTRDSECTSFDMWSECRHNRCQCLPSMYEGIGGCFPLPDDGIDRRPVGFSARTKSIVAFILIPIVILISCALMVVRFVQRRDMVTIAVNSTTRRVEPEASVQIPVEDAEPPAFEAPPSYSETMGIPKH